MQSRFTTMSPKDMDVRNNFFNPLPDMPILGFANSAPDKDTMSTL